MGINTAAAKRGFRWDEASNKLKIYAEGEMVGSFLTPTTSLTKIYVDPDGDDTNGTGSAIAPVATITQAFTLVSSTRKVIILGAGDYAEAAGLTWPTTDDVKLIGAGCAVTSISATTSAGGSVITVAPGAVSGTFDGMIQGVQIDHSAGSAQKGVTFDNTSMGKKLLFTFRHCSFASNASTDKSINMETHGDASNAVKIYVQGDGTQGTEIEGAVYFAAGNDTDRLHFDSCWLSGTVTCVGAIELRVRAYRCVYPEGAGFVGSGLQAHTIVNGFGYTDYNELTAEIFTAGDGSDISGGCTEVTVNS